MGHRDVYSYHGYYGERLYAVWSSMKGRCYNKNNDKYKNYGERNIKVCDDWKNSYESFRSWAYKNGYDDGAKYGECTLDRIDVNGNYEPSNCRFVSIAEQMINTTRNKEFICVETGVIWNNIHECARKMALNYKNIWAVLNGKKKSHGGYRFRYI